MEGAGWAVEEGRCKVGRIGGQWGCELGGGRCEVEGGMWKKGCQGEARSVEVRCEGGAGKNMSR